MITVFRDRYVPSPDSEEVERDPETGAPILPADAVFAVPLDDALARHWDTDAHLVQYAPVEVNGVRIRLPISALEPANLTVIGGAVTMIARFGDIDDKVAHENGTPAREEWRTEVLPRIQASGLAYYSTRGGYRLIERLPEGCTLTNHADGEDWKRCYLGWCEYLKVAHGLELDTACKDWTRLFRLPNVVRDGVPCSAAVVGAITTADLSLAVEGPLPIASRAAGTVATELERALALARALPPSVSGADGNATLFRAACEISTILGSDADAIGTALREFNMRCLPPWPESVITREARRAAERRLEIESDPVTKAMERLEAMRESVSERIATDRKVPVLLSAASSKMYAYDASNDCYRGPYAHKRMRIVCRELGIDFALRKADGTYMSYDGIYDSGAHIERVVRSFSETRTWYDPEASELHQGYVLAPYTAAEDPIVGAWLAALCGPMLPNVLTWIASCSQSCITRKAAALVLVGPPGVGKTLIFRALARLWGARSFVPLSDSIAQFNGTITRCPIVVDDECSALKARTVTSAEFRSRVQATERDYELKGQEKVELVGCTREGITANDIGEVTFADVRGAGVVEALRDRLLVVEVPDPAQARSALAAVRGTGDDDAEIDRIARHCAWIWTHAVPADAGRFIGAGGHASERVALASVIDDGAELWETLPLGEKAGWVEHEGALHANAAALTEHLTLSGLRGWDLKRVIGLLRAVASGPPVRIRGEGARLRYWPIDPRLIKQMIE